jgi:hypothetical protein
MKRLKPFLIVAPIGIFIYNRVDKGKPTVLLPAEKHIVVIGGGITGIVTSYYLTMDSKTKVTLLEKNKQTMTEASAHDSGLLFNNNVSFRTFGSQPFGLLNSLLRVDGPNSVYSTHMAKEPGLIKFTWHWLIAQFNTRTKFLTRQSVNSHYNLKLAELTTESYADLLSLLQDTNLDFQL